MIRTIAWATLVAGTLDILSAFLWSALLGGPLDTILPTIALGAFGMFGELSRGEAWLLVPVVWAIMLLWSKPWLDRYRYGPFEWAWRSLSRWKWEPMRKRASAEIPATA